MSYELNRKGSKNQDKEAVWFDLLYSDVDLFSVTVVDAYRTPEVHIMNQKELDSFLKDF